jgi:hypothetical protein
LSIARTEPQPQGSARSEPVKLWSLSTLALIGVNLVPIFGALFLGWNLGMVMLLYWAESGVVGFYNLCKMAVIGRWQALSKGPLFVVHFGAFMFAHFVFLYVLFIAGPEAAFSGDPFTDVAALFRSVWPAIVGLFVSHGISFFSNFLGRREYEGRTIGRQMSEPYQRIMFMQLVLIFGGGITMILGDSRPVLMGAICFKVVFDVRAHLKERRV